MRTPNKLDPQYTISSLYSWLSDYLHLILNVNEWTSKIREAINGSERGRLRERESV